MNFYISFSYFILLSLLQRHLSRCSNLHEMLDHSSVESINYLHYLRHWHFLQVSFQMLQLSKEIDSPGICRQSTFPAR